MLGGTTGNLIADMRSKGVEPESVETVIFTHLHFDHVGWSIADDKPVFEKARYLVPQADWEFFRSEAQASDNPHVDAQIAPLEGLGVLELVSGEKEITPDLTLVPTPGHTPGHQSVAISSAGELAFILGDVANHPAQVEETEWCAGFDGDPDTARVTRKQIMERLEATAAWWPPVISRRRDWAASCASRGSGFSGACNGLGRAAARGLERASTPA